MRYPDLHYRRVRPLAAILPPASARKALILRMTPDAMLLVSKEQVPPATPLVLELSGACVRRKVVLRGRVLRCGPSTRDRFEEGGLYEALVSLTEPGRDYAGFLRRLMSDPLLTQS